jgi:peroxiredoxin
MNALFAAAFSFSFLTLGLSSPALAQGNAAHPHSTATRLLTMQLPASAEPTQPQTYRLVGRVFGPAGRAQPGATLVLKGTSTVATTDAGGNFTLDLPLQTLSTLVVGYVGCEELMIPLATPRGMLTINLRPSLAAGLAQALRIGDFAPDFDLPTANGQNFKLSEHRGHPVVLYFYPKDGSPGCTKEACSFRDQYQEFEAMGAEVIGISSDSEVSHRAFATKNALPFPLLSDEGGQLRKKYAVPRAVLGLLPGRVTYVLDEEGRVQYVFNSLNAATNHVLNAKTILSDSH